MRFPFARKGIKKIQAGEILLLISYFTMYSAAFVDVLRGGPASSGSMTALIIEISAIVLTALLIFSSVILDLIGYGQASKDEEFFIHAVIFELVSLALIIVITVMPSGNGAFVSVLGILLTVMQQLTRILAIIFVIHSTVRLAKRCGRSSMAVFGQTAGILIIIMSLVSVAGNVFLYFAGNIIQDITAAIIVISLVSVISFIIVLIRSIIYIVYLLRVSSMLKKEILPETPENTGETADTYVQRVPEY